MKTEKDFNEYLNTIRQLAADEGYDSLDETFVEHERCRFFGQEVVIARSERILLRELKMSDLEAFYGFSGAMEEPVLQAFLKESPEASEAYLKAYISSMYPLYDYGMWAVVHTETGEILGLCGFGRTSISGEEVTDLGYYMKPEARRRGLAAEAVCLALEYGKSYLELSNVYAIVHPDNAGSIRLLCKAGFQSLESDSQGMAVYRKKL